MKKQKEKVQEYQCEDCNQVWASNEGIKKKCPICRGEMDSHYKKIVLEEKKHA